ncbi:MAG: ferredoxin family protein [Dethiobacteria bacterium]|jgi:NAD-dependent dihydropyrimidine dehydrogenase PreA subunit|nr:ferredoxin family protein [Bacillota bacterium]HOL16462.1 ferredoxin family protein [Bacillota bacterium]
MEKKKVLALPNVNAPSGPVTFNPEACKGCNNCMEVCPMDVYIPNPEKGKPPIVLHPDECWYCGCCVMACPHKGAIKFNWPLQQRGYWKDKKTGEIFRA